MVPCSNRLRAIKEKICWCLKRHLACLQSPRVLFSYLVFVVFLYLTWTVLANDTSRIAVERHVGPATAAPRPSPPALVEKQKPTAIIKTRYLNQLRIPRTNYTEPRSSFISLLARSSSLHPGQTLVQPPSVISAGEAVLKSVSAVERKRRPTPQSPPQFKDNSPYKVYKNYFGPPAAKIRNGQVGVANETSSMTYATHATANYLKYLVDLSRRWNGPLSVAVYAPGADFALAVELIVYLRACFPTVRNMASFHMIYDADVPPVEFPHHLNWVNVSADCSGNIYEKHFVSRNGSVLPYPVNVARNVARACSRTRHVLVSDVELMPSFDLIGKFNLFMQQEARKTATGPNNHKVYVLPVFEIAPGREVPKTKRDLVAMIKARTAFYFHSLVCPHCQRFPGINQWISGEKPTDNIKIFTATKREGIYQRWEPVYIGTKKDPFFDERLTWDGLQDKMSQALEMCLIGYKFIVLDSAFLVHRPGLRTISYTSDDPSVKWRRPFVAHNRNATHIIAEELRMKYPGAFKRGMCHSEPEQTDEAER